MDPILYLGVEGVLFRARVCRHPLAQRGNEMPCLNPLPLLGLISSLLETQRDLRVVLNSWWIVDYGFRRLVDSLPSSISQRTIGATIPGNRLHRKIAYQERVDLLRADVKKRQPVELTIVDASRSAIPTEYLSRSVWVRSDNQTHINESAAALLGFFKQTGPLYQDSIISIQEAERADCGSTESMGNRAEELRRIA
ncbi:hypothetical protein AWB75_04141 [Caballeronia catudaia]|uniref:Uncharacterized protein n=1 Tax=Caballeronia catudaia TaxID=1777136 RepID=A0A158BWP1_9BURK|nr:HAD domain-containing protein [Caballeronia catudaia]SAK74400.1 hypothetical protein AWB75_04141 [Caballeronia catudaia]